MPASVTAGSEKSCPKAILPPPTPRDSSGRHSRPFHAAPTLHLPSSCFPRFAHPAVSRCPRGRLLGCHTEPHRGDSAGAGDRAQSSFSSEVQEHKPSKLHLCQMAQRWPHTNTTPERSGQETSHRYSPSPGAGRNTLFLRGRCMGD